MASFIQRAHLFVSLSTTEHSVPEEGRQWWSKRRSKSNIASCVIMKFVSNIYIYLVMCGCSGCVLLVGGGSVEQGATLSVCRCFQIS